MSGAHLILALDQGTTSSRAVLVDREGRIVASTQRELRQHYPQPGWVEQDPGEIWTTQRDTTREALAQAGVGAAQIRAIGITNQRETTIVWDRVSGEVADLVAAIEEGFHMKPIEVRADGGASGSDLLLQAQADLLGVPVQRAAQPESTALGAAYLAGLAVGLWRDEAEVATLWRSARRFEPRPGTDVVRRRADWKRAVECVGAFGSPPAADGPASVPDPGSR